MEEPNAQGIGEEFADELQSLARKHWLPGGTKKLPKFNARVVDQIFHGLSERSFPLKELLILDQTLYLEKYANLICIVSLLIDFIVICGQTFPKRRLISLFCLLHSLLLSKRTRSYQYGVFTNFGGIDSDCRRFQTQSRFLSGVVSSCFGYDFSYDNILYNSSITPCLCDPCISVSRRSICEERSGNPGSDTYMGGVVF